MKQIEIYTDGACRGNPGPGGYGAVLKYRQHRKEISGGFRETTNNRMEIYAAIAALEQLIEPCEITLYSDSRYLVDAISKRWLANWRRRGWIKADRQPVLNVDLWRRLEEAMAPHRLKFVWVRGHASNAENNRCDELAVAAATRGISRGPAVTAGGRGRIMRRS
ncbi:MAG: ribonuclease HI [Lentisphaeria bacterium]|nr:MAG: ribonuclease HI [Lentisphaeria bacterium]